MIMVKLGGSLFHSPFLKTWLEKLNKLSQAESIIIIPGGGPFADQVRQAQQHHDFDDRHAHHMAILAMSQFGILLLGLSQHAQPFYYPTKRTKNNQASLSIWLPDKDLLNQQDIMQSWDVSSDSLALWFAQQLKPNKLTLLKQNPPKQQSVQQLIDEKILDNAFSSYFNDTEVPVELFDASQIDTYALTTPEQVLQI